MNKRIKARLSCRTLLAVIALALAPLCAFAQKPVPPVPNPCPRFTAGGVIQQPPALFSQHGVLNVLFSYQTTTDSYGRQLYCFMTPNGLENPTLHLNPGDTLNITVTNNAPTSPVGEMFEAYNPPNCGDTTQQTQDPTQNNGMTGGSMNIHYHGTNTSPACHEDNVVKTLINSNSTFQYSVHFPANEPPGLYWYHPHVHGLAEAAVLGGAAGALVIDGINNVQPAVAGLRSRVIMLRDQPTIQGLQQSKGGTEGGIPQHDLTVDFVPLDTYTDTHTGITSYTPAVVQMMRGEQQFWRVSNSTSDAPLDLQVRFDGVAQTIQLVGIDAVPVNSQDQEEDDQPDLIPVTHFRLPPASRVEFIIKAPSPSVQVAQLVAQLINSGPLGDDLPTRPLLNIQLSQNDENLNESRDDRIPPFTHLNTKQQQRFGGIKKEPVARTRTLYFDEHEDGTAFFVNFDSCVPASDPLCAPQPYPVDTAFNNNNPPALITAQGSVEKWIFQNRARENHELHQHQIHFMVLEQDNFEANGSQQAPGINNQFLDMIEIPFCNAVGPGCPAPFAWPQVQLLMDFRGPDIGDFVFHCHILGHEDLGMMAIERVIQQH
jgi:FtsP/CotA-like multicopper oxidase with cupredoxin domain